MSVPVMRMLNFPSVSCISSSLSSKLSTTFISVGASTFACVCFCVVDFLVCFVCLVSFFPSVSVWVFVSWLIMLSVACGTLVVVSCCACVSICGVLVVICSCCVTCCVVCGAFSTVCACCCELSFTTTVAPSVSSNCPSNASCCSAYALDFSGVIVPFSVSCVIFSFMFCICSSIKLARKFVLPVTATIPPCIIPLAKAPMVNDCSMFSIVTGSMFSFDL